MAGAFNSASPVGTSEPAPKLTVRFFDDGSFRIDRLDGEASEKRCATSLSDEFLASISSNQHHADSQQLLPTAMDDASKSGAAAKHREAGILVRMLGKGVAPPSLASGTFILWSALGSFLGILVLSLLHYELMLAETDDLVMFVGSFGAQAVLLFAANGSPLAQPWNCIFGNVISSAVGVTVWKMVGSEAGMGLIWLAPPFAVSLAITAMHLTKSMHPPAGATAMIACIGTRKIHDLGYMYVLFPALVGSLIHVLVALVVNNLSQRPNRHFPSSWRFWSDEDLMLLRSWLPVPSASPAKMNDPGKTAADV